MSARRSQPAAVQRILSYAGQPEGVCDDGASWKAYFRRIDRPYGTLTDDEMAAARRDLHAPAARRPRDAALRSGDGAAVRAPPATTTNSGRPWDSLALPVLCLRGETSDLLLLEVAEAMRQRGPRAMVVTVPGCGHAPALNTPDQFGLIERFLVAAG